MKKRKGGCLRFLLRFLLIWLFVLLMLIGFRLFKEHKFAQGEKDVEAYQEIPYQEDSEGEEKFALHYYYSLLSNKEEKRIYREIYQGLKNR